MQCVSVLFRNVPYLMMKSFNPTYESHQESLAQAVAEETKKVYQNELGPEPIPFTVPVNSIDDEDVRAIYPMVCDSEEIEDCYTNSLTKLAVV
ncbi:hypothetical protein QYF36_000964 [Acer negundo]|nr:hypothetical protein QYF36_000964 [Acer negundo]